MAMVGLRGDNPYEYGFDARERRRPAPDVFNDATYKNGEQVKSDPFGTYTTGGYQPSADPFQVERAPRTGAGPYGAPTGGINPYPNPTYAPQPQQPQQPNLSGNYDAFGQAWLGSGGRTVQDLQNFIQNNPQYGATLGGSKNDKVTVGGRAYDAVYAAGLGGQGATWNFLDPNAPAGGGNTFAGAQEFTDPLTAQYERLAKSRIDQLFNPLTPGQDETSMIGQARARVANLQGPAYSAGDREVLRTQFTDPLGAQREAAKQQVKQRMAASGIQGGLVERALQEVDRQYDAMMAANTRQLAEKEIARGDQRQSEAMDLQKYLATAEQARTAFQEGRYQEAVELSNRLSQLPERRIQQANAVLNGGQSPQSLFNSVMQYGSYGQQNQMYNQQQQDAYLQQLIEAFSKLFG